MVDGPITYVFRIVHSKLSSRRKNARHFLFVRTHGPTKTIDRVPKSTEQFLNMSEKTINGLYQEVMVDYGVRVGVNVKPRD